MNYPQALLRAVCTITDVRIVQFVLTLTADFLSYDTDRRVRFFTRPGAPPGETRPFVLPFLQLVGTANSGARVPSVEQNPYVLDHAAQIASLMLSVDCSDAPAASGMLAWIMTQLRQYGAPGPRQVKLTEVAVQSLMVLVRSELLCRLFVEEQGVERLMPLLASRNAQLVYDVLFSLWTLSLHAELVPAIERAGATSAVARLFRVGVPLKVLRMGAAMLVNVARHPACKDSVAEICETHVGEVVDSLLHAENKITDPELVRSGYAYGSSPVAGPLADSATRFLPHVPEPYSYLVHVASHAHRPAAPPCSWTTCTSCERLSAPTGERSHLWSGT